MIQHYVTNEILAVVELALLRQCLAFLAIIQIIYLVKRCSVQIDCTDLEMPHRMDKSLETAHIHPVDLCKAQNAFGDALKP